MAIGRDLWDPVSGVRRLALESPPQMSDLRSVAFSPNGKSAALSGGTLYHYQVRLFDTASGKLQRTLLGFEAAISFAESVAFSPDGSRLAAAADGLRIWDARSGAPIRQLRLPGDEDRSTTVVRQVAFSPDGGLLAAVTEGSDNGSRPPSFGVRLWNASTGELARALPAEHGTRVAFSPDGRLLAVAGAEIHLFDPATGEARGTLTSGGGPVRSIAFLPGGKRLAAGTLDGTVQLWRLP